MLSPHVSHHRTNDLLRLWNWKGRLCMLRSRCMISGQFSQADSESPVHIVLELQVGTLQQCANVHSSRWIHIYLWLPVMHNIFIILVVIFILCLASNWFCEKTAAMRLLLVYDILVSLTFSLTAQGSTGRFAWQVFTAAMVDLEVAVFPYMLMYVTVCSESHLRLFLNGTAAMVNFSYPMPHSIHFRVFHHHSKEFGEFNIWYHLVILYCQYCIISSHFYLRLSLMHWHLSDSLQVHPPKSRIIMGSAYI
jgi:hypothetical protein